MNGTQGTLATHPRTLGEIAEYYHVSARTVRRWLKRAGLEELTVRRGSGSRFYTILELRRIAEALGD